MCPPKVQTPEAPKAPPPLLAGPSATATRINRAGSGSGQRKFSFSNPYNFFKRSRGLSSLRVDLGVPNSEGGGGLSVPR